MREDCGVEEEEEAEGELGGGLAGFVVGRGEGWTHHAAAEVDASCAHIGVVEPGWRGEFVEETV